MADLSRCCRPCLQRLARSQRLFSTSAIQKKYGNLPTFEPTSSPELDALLSTWRKNIIQPAQLKENQRKLIYRRKHWPLLTNPDEPATARIGDEVVQLLPIDITKDLPDTRKSVQKALTLMKETGEWRNLRGFLEGLNHAGRKLEDDHKEKIARWMTESGAHSELLRLLVHADQTGIGFWNLRVAREVMWGAWQQAIVDGEITDESLDKATKYAETVWTLMWEPQHTSRFDPQSPPTQQPDIIGVLLLLHSAKALRTGAGAGADSDAVARVKDYAQSLFRYWDKLDPSIGKEADWVKVNRQICMLAPLLQGLKLAREAVGDASPLQTSLAAKETEISEPLEEAVAFLKSNTPEKRNRAGLMACDAMSRFEVGQTS